MRLDELDFDLPQDRIAQRPLPRREDARLMVVEPGASPFGHRKVQDLPDLLRPALFVFNDSRVLPARLQGTSEEGKTTEFLLVEAREEGSSGEQTWLAMARGLRSLRPGLLFRFGQGELEGQVGERAEEGLVLLQLRSKGMSIEEAVVRVGEMPLPPYMRRAADAEDEERYQTVYARTYGSVAAPTAGLHFSPELLARLEEKGHRGAFLTLHVGPGTFRPVQSETLEGHAMHSERYTVSDACASALAQAKDEGRPVIAVGTTVVRTLEGACDEQGVVPAGSGRTSLMISPPYRFRVVEGMMTNFHLPRSTLLALVMAFAGIETTRQAYAEAIAENYRFYSYGDAMLLRPAAFRRP